MKDIIKIFPLFGIYIFIVLVASTNTFQGDESRYVLFANNLSQGFYSSSDNITLTNGPGYPIVLLPFVIFKLPWIMAKLLNALFLFWGMIYFYNALRFYMSERFALYFTYALGVYPPMLVQIHLLLTESFVFFLICGFLFHFCKLYNSSRKNRWIQLIITSCYLGSFILTKIYYAYIFLGILLLIVLLYFLKRRDSLKNSLLVYLFAFIICLPYLFYTHSLTGKYFYLGNAGGQSLYWMSTPYNNEFGDWHGEPLDKNPDLLKNHEDFFKKISTLGTIQKDEVLKKEGIRNIKNHPGKFFRNWLANIGRMLFSYPFSYTYQKLTTFFYIIPNMFIIVISFLLVYPSYKGRRLIPDEIWLLLMFVFIMFVGSSLVSAYSRQFSILVPIVVFCIFFTITRILKIEIRH